MSPMRPTKPQSPYSDQAEDGGVKARERAEMSIKSLEGDSNGEVKYALGTLLLVS